MSKRANSPTSSRLINPQNEYIGSSPTSPRSPQEVSFLENEGNFSTQSASKASEEILGLIFMILSTFVFSTMSFLVKVASMSSETPSKPGWHQKFPSFEIVLSRSLFQWFGAWSFFFLYYSCFKSSNGCSISSNIYGIGDGKFMQLMRELPTYLRWKLRKYKHWLVHFSILRVNESDSHEMLVSPSSPNSTDGLINRPDTTFDTSEMMAPESASQNSPNITFANRGQALSLESSCLMWLIFRGLSGSIGLALFFYAISVLPLADATVIFFTGPPLTSIIAYFMLDESLSVLDIVAVVSCLFGVVLVARPPSLFGRQDGSPTSNFGDDIDNFTRSTGILSALVGALMSAIAYSSVRKITKINPTIPSMTHVYYFGMISSIFSPIAMFIVGQQFVLPRGLMDWVLLGGVGLMAFAGQALLNRGLQLADAGPATLMRNLDVVFAFMFGEFIMLKEIITFDFLGSLILKEKVYWTSYVGALIIISFAVLVGWKRWKKAQRKRRRSSLESGNISGDNPSISG